MNNDNDFKLYTEYNKSLRAWLVGFGFGVPALFIINQEAQSKLIKSEDSQCIIYMFLIGASAQVILAFINKTIAWCSLHKETFNGKVRSCVDFIANLENWFIIDIVCDLTSLGTFGYSIFKLVNLFSH